MYATICPDCGAHLDPGERCDCRHETNKPLPAAYPVGAGLCSARKTQQRRATSARKTSAAVPGTYRRWQKWM